MKKLFLLLFLAGIFVSLSAQNDEKEILGKYNVTQWPEVPFPSDYKTLKVDVTTNDLYLRDAIGQSIYISGYKKLDKSSTETPDIKITVEAYPFQFANCETYSYINTTKVNGVEKKQTLWGYKGSVKYKFNVIIKGRNDSIYSNEEYSNSKDLSSNGIESAKSAAEFLTSAREGAPGEIVQSIFSNMHYSLSDKFGIVKKQLVPISFTIKVSKRCKMDYSDLISAHELLKSSFALVATNEDNTKQFLTTVTPSLEKWENALKESDIKNRKARIEKDITCAIYHNIGTVYFLAKDYEKAIGYFSKCIEIRKSYGDAYDFRRLSEDLMKRNKINKK